MPQSPKVETHKEGKNKSEGSLVREIKGQLRNKGWFMERVTLEPDFEGLALGELEKVVVVLRVKLQQTLNASQKAQPTGEQEAP